MPANGRPGGPRWEPRTSAAAIEAVLDLVSAGASLSGLSLVAIAGHAGVSRNSLYRRWKTKEDLYLDVLAAVNKPLPEFAGPTARDDLAAFVTVLAERNLDQRARSMLRALTAEAAGFPGLYRRYFEEIITPRREAGYAIIRRGIAAGEIRSDVDIGLLREVLVAPILARMNSGAAGDPDPDQAGRQIVDLLYRGIQPRSESPAGALRSAAPAGRPGQGNAGPAG